MTRFISALVATVAMFGADADEGRLRDCRSCGEKLRHTFVDLGTSPLCQRHVTPARYFEPEDTYPLHAYVCNECFLVQLPNCVAREEIFNDEYGYFSSYSDSWLRHAELYVSSMIARFGFGSGSRVVEIASNDGYLLQYFARAGVPVLGIEPSRNTAAAAVGKGIPTITEFFGRETARRVLASHGPADLILGNNVLAHVPDINDFVAGVRILLAPGGIVTFEFPQLLTLVAQNYWDTIYHEHFSYLSFTTVVGIFARHGLELFDVEELPTHGGSIRIFGRHAQAPSPPRHPRVAAMLARERAAGHFDLAYYEGFGDRVKESKREILELLTSLKRQGAVIAGYGAPGKGNTLLNYCGIRTDFIDFTVDRNPHKQGNYLPGSRIPILAPEAIFANRPDYVFILPWNLKDEIIAQMAGIRDWGGKFIVPLPHIGVIA